MDLKHLAVSTADTEEEKKENRKNEKLGLSCTTFSSNRLTNFFFTFPPLSA